MLVGGIIAQAQRIPRVNLEHYLHASDDFVELIVAKLRVRFAEIRPGVDVIEHQLEGITMNVVV
jgi:hypothetical protein